MRVEPYAPAGGRSLVPVEAGAFWQAINATRLLAHSDQVTGEWRTEPMRMSNIIAAVTTAFLTTVALAQAPAPAPPAAVPQAPECSRGALPATPGETTGSTDLGDQLSRSKGIICPPAGVDPGISAPLVGGGRTPVIPPPGTPGGDPTIIPK
jgi:hypothetical protein